MQKHKLEQHLHSPMSLSDSQRHTYTYKPNEGAAL